MRFEHFLRRRGDRGDRTALINDRPARFITRLGVAAELFVELAVRFDRALRASDVAKLALRADDLLL